MGFFVFGAVGASLALGKALPSRGGDRDAPSTTYDALSPEQAHAIAVNAYVFGYPLVTMEMTRRVMTNAARDEGRRAPMGQFAKMRTYPTPEDHDVTAPSADTLYTAAWVDVSDEPYVLSTPDMKGRYFLFPIFDAWTDVVLAPGTRATGTKPQTYVITGPSWKGGVLPRGATRVESPTDLVWIPGHIYTTGAPGDLDAVRALQDRVSLVPLRAHGKPYAPPLGPVDPSVDTKTAVREQVDALDAASFFGTMTALMAHDPPSPEDRPALARMAKIGIAPGQPFDRSKLTPQVVKAIESAPAEALQRIQAAARAAPEKVNDWLVLLKAGRYGTDYLLRAAVAAEGLGANLPRDAVCPVAIEDAGGQPFDGSHRYVLRVDARRLPPVYGFWSLTMYDDKMFFVPNPLGRYTIGQGTRLLADHEGTI